MAKYQDRQPSEYEEKLIRISRVSKKTKGGNQMGFTALMVIGDKKGKVGVGLGKAKDVMTAVQKGIRQAKKKMITVPIDGTTIPFAIEARHGAGRVLLKPASKGSGVIAGGPVRAVVEVAGIKDISAKILGSQNQASSVHATMKALDDMRKIVQVRGIKVEQEKEIVAQEQSTISSPTPLVVKSKDPEKLTAKVVAKNNLVKKKQQPKTDSAKK